MARKSEGAESSAASASCSRGRQHTPVLGKPRRLLGVAVGPRGPAAVRKLPVPSANTGPAMQTAQLLILGSANARRGSTPHTPGTAAQEKAAPEQPKARK